MGIYSVKTFDGKWVKKMTPIDELKIFSSAGSDINKALRTLAYASIFEMNLLLDKINYYLEHINIITSSEFVYKNKTDLHFKKEFLENLQAILKNEILKRNDASIAT